MSHTKSSLLMQQTVRNYTALLVAKIWLPPCKETMLSHIVELTTTFDRWVAVIGVTLRVSCVPGQW